MRNLRSPSAGRSGLSRLIGGAVLALAFTACDAPTLARPAFAYSPTSLTGGQLYRWPSGRTVRVFIVPQPAGATLDLFSAARTAVLEWNQLPLFREYQLQFSSLEEADIIVVDRTSPLPIVPDAACPFATNNAAGYTYFCPVNGRAATLARTGGGTTRASVVISVDPGRLESQTRMNAVVAHEFGHALGIGGHSDVSTDLMFASPTVAVPSNRDAQTLQYVLGQRPAFYL